MNSNKKIILLLSLCLGFTELNCSQKSRSLASFVDPNFVEKQSINDMHTTVSQNDMANTISLRKRSAENENLQNFEHRADELIKQNYKTDQMKYDILLLMNSNLFSVENSPKQKNPTIINDRNNIPLDQKENIKNFMIVNIATASIDNLPTIHEILTKTTGINPANGNKFLATKGLQATLRAINGAIADVTFDKKSMFAADEITLKLRNMQKRIETRLNEISPTYWRHLAIGVGALATIAAATSIYYSGITMKDSQEYIAGLMKQYKPTDITETAKAAIPSIAQQSILGNYSEYLKIQLPSIRS